MIRSNFRRLLVLCGVAVVFVCGPSASATTLTYNFTVTATSGPLVGDVSNGSFSFDSSAIVLGGVNSNTNLLTALDFTWDGITYNASDANTGNLEFNSSGDLTSFAFGNACFPGVCVVSANTEDWFGDPNDFVYSVTGGSISFGTLTFSEAAAATPEPGTLVMMGTALLSGVGLLRRRLRS